MESLISNMEKLREMIPRWRKNSDEKSRACYWIKLNCWRIISKQLCEIPLRAITQKLPKPRIKTIIVEPGYPWISGPTYDYWLPYEAAIPKPPDYLKEEDILGQELLEDMLEVIKMPKWKKMSEEKPEKKDGETIWIWTQNGVRQCIYRFSYEGWIHLYYDHKHNYENLDDFSYEYHQHHFQMVIEDVEYWMPYKSILDTIQES